MAPPLQEPKEQVSQRPDLLSMFISANDANGEPLLPSDQYLRDVMLNFLIAGRDTTAVALTWLFLELSRHPEVVAKIRLELREVLDGHPPTFDECNQKLPYLDAVVLESLRLYPPVPKDAKMAVADDTLPDGTFIPAGTSIVYIIYAMGRLERIWGPDAAVFRPERMLDAGIPNAYKYPVFNAGPRVCLGRQMALLEIKVAVWALLPHFDFEHQGPPKPVPSVSITMPMVGGLPMLVTAV